MRVVLVVFNQLFVNPNVRADTLPVNKPSKKTLTTTVSYQPLDSNPSKCLICGNVMPLLKAKASLRTLSAIT